MKSKREKPIEAENSMGWLCTFNDLMTLLMVFFVLIFSLSTIDVDKASGMIGSLQSGLGVLEAGAHVDVSIIDPHPSIASLENDMGNLSEVYSEILSDLDKSYKEHLYDDEIQRTRNYLTHKNMNDVDVIPGVSARYTPKGIYITMADYLLFSSGSAKINEDGYPVLNKVLASVNKTGYQIRIEGHTDDIPIHTQKYPTNWELSMDRAMHVLKYFIKNGNVSPTRLSVVGYGDVKPVADNDSVEGRGKNRRVEIVLFKKGTNSNGQ